jgi:hypothetical protein
MGRALQHYLNPLHIYCRLMDIGIPKSVAGLLCRTYERLVFRQLKGGGCVNKHRIS